MTTATSWQILGDILEACSCDVTCPCNFGGGPTELPCEAIFAFRVLEGSYGNIELNDLNFALYLRSPGLIFQGNWTLGHILTTGPTRSKCRLWGPFYQERLAAYSPH